MLSGDYMCYYYLWKERGSDPQCCLCPTSQILPETHILLLCRGTCETRSKVWPELLNTIADISPKNGMLDSSTAPDIATQFFLDCTSLNLPNGYRIDNYQPRIHELLRVVRQYCHAVHSDRVSQLKKIKIVKQ